MNRYAVTVGIMYADHPHPVLTPEQADPDGYLLVQAEDIPAAREKVQAVLGRNYAFIYPEADLIGSRYHTKGCVGEIVHGVIPPLMLVPAEIIEALPVLDDEGKRRDAEMMRSLAADVVRRSGE